ncbi:AraC family transcriptional regulator [Paenibacillus chungangensis]|uniref:AraC family transcriptional regulator n=1 Tax=Paenibacillus chungangensis TaxID=696535 RepID=A0ABW3HU30_9BACL
MQHRRLKLSRIINVNSVISFRYTEFPRSFKAQDCYDFWQMFYVDKGVWEFCAEPNTFAMEQGDCLLVPPGVIRRSQTKQVTPPNVLILSFECRSATMKRLSRRIFRLNDQERHILSMLIREGNNAFLPPPLNPTSSKEPLSLNEQALLGSHQLVRNYIEVLLVSLLRRIELDRTTPNLPTVSQENREKSAIDKLLQYIEENLGDDLSLPSLCRKFAISRTHLYNAFKKRFGCGISEYVRRARFEQAKLFIREETSSMTEIAERLGYSSIHYFSRDFKKMIGMTPTEYAKSIQAKVSRT